MSKSKSSKASRRRSTSNRAPPYVRTRSDTFGHTYTLKSGTLLHTGTVDGTASFPLFLTPHRALAKMYAGANGSVLSFRTARPLRLLSKGDALWGVKLGKVDRGEWQGFGTDESDFPIAKALCRRASTSTTSWVYGMDGWIYRYSSRTLGEVLVCDPTALNAVDERGR